MAYETKPVGFADYGSFAYRAYAVPLLTGNWEAWYVIHDPASRRILCGPTKLPWQFSAGEAANEAAEKKARWEIDHSFGVRPRQFGD